MTDGWVVRFDGYEPADEGRREALCTLGNGYFATRGAAPEASADDVHYPGTYAAGLYNRLQAEVAGEVVENESVVNLPNWLAVQFRVEDGPWFNADTADLLEYRQELDLRRAVLTRRVRFRDGGGRTTTVSERRFVHLRSEHVCALEMTFVAEDWSGRLAVRSAIDGNVGNTQIARYRDLGTRHLDLVAVREPSADTLQLEMATSQSAVRVAVAARNRLWAGDEPLDPTPAASRASPAASREVVGDGALVGHLIGVDLRRGEPVTLEKVATIYTSRDPALSEPGVEAGLWLPRLGRFAQLLAGHELAWRHLWDRFHVDIEHPHGWQEILRLHVFHVLQTLSGNTVELDAGVPARGLHGEAYRGHVFWDELFVLPMLTLHTPLVTRSLLRYRERRLPEAREAARAAGYAGAMYPWQSGSDGREENQRIHLNPRSGRWLPDATHRQRHVGIAVAYNVWQYYQATGDVAFLRNHGAEMLLEIARFWASLATFDPARGRYVIRGVMGPDEFHTGYPGAEEAGIDNNAYTNVMAAWVLRRAVECLDVVPAPAGLELRETLGLGGDELEHWGDIAGKLFVPFHDGGIITQFEGYEQLRELDWDAYRARYGNIGRLDRILEAEGDSVNRYKVSKQADVLMLFYLLSADELRELLEPLGYALAPDAIPRTIQYYLSRTSHGSSLSAIVHAWVLARGQRDRAREFLTDALEADVADIQGGTTREGIHLAAMAGSVDLLQRCFSGLETRGDRLQLNPAWPRGVGVLEFALQYREHPLLVRIHDHQVEVRAGAGTQQPIEVACGSEVAQVSPGSSVVFRL